MRQTQVRSLPPCGGGLGRGGVADAVNEMQAKCATFDAMARSRKNEWANGMFRVGEGTYLYPAHELECVDKPSGPHRIHRCFEFTEIERGGLVIDGDQFATARRGNHPGCDPHHASHSGLRGLWNGQEVP